MSAHSRVTSGVVSGPYQQSVHLLVFRVINKSFRRNCMLMFQVWESTSGKHFGQFVSLILFLLQAFFPYCGLHCVYWCFFLVHCCSSTNKNMTTRLSAQQSAPEELGEFDRTQKAKGFAVPPPRLFPCSYCSWIEMWICSSDLSSALPVVSRIVSWSKILIWDIISGACRLSMLF